MTVSVRLGGPDDVDAAVDVYIRSGTARRGGGRMSDERIVQVGAMLRLPETWFFVAHDDGMPVGMAAAMPSREKEGAGKTGLSRAASDPASSAVSEWAPDL